MAKIMISLPDGLLRDADRLARRQRRSRSELFREALRAMLQEDTPARPTWGDLAGAVRERIQNHWVGHWDSTDVIREDRDAEPGRRPRR